MILIVEKDTILTGIVPVDKRKNMLMKKVLVFIQAKEEHPVLTKPQLCKMIRISDSSLKRIMKDLNMKFLSSWAACNRKRTDLTVTKKINKGIKILSLRSGTIANTNQVRGFVSPNDISEMEKTPIINYDNMLSDYLVGD